MTGEEKSKLILLLQDMIRQRDEESKRKDDENARLGSRLDEVLHKLDESNSRIILTQLLSQIQKDSSEKDKLIASFLSENSNLKDGIAKSRKERFGRKSQKSDKAQETKSRAEDKNGVDGSENDGVFSNRIS